MRYPDNPDHPNGTCEACGEPCEVYGCRYCPDCYEEESAKDRKQFTIERQEVQKPSN